MIKSLIVPSSPAESNTVLQKYFVSKYLDTSSYTASEICNIFPAMSLSEATIYILTY